VVHALLAGAAVLVSMALVFGGTGPTPVATTFFYVWIALYVAWFFPMRTAIAHVVGDGALFAGMLAVERFPAGPAVWLLVMGTATVVGAVVTLMHRELIRVANRDPLTGLPTRHVLGEAFTREMARARRSSAPLCLVILDVDGLKTVNDRDGHTAGDRLLAHAAYAWRSALRDTDLLFRFGGDEFVALVPDCSPEAASDVIFRLRAASTVRFSAGVAWWDEGDDLVAVLERADAELYKVKRSLYGQPQSRTTFPYAIA
jgi:diguanylate cyclase (GGDEF)-like protein